MAKVQLVVAKSLCVVKSSVGSFLTMTLIAYVTIAFNMT